jgi:hypothetical protein
MPKNRIDNEVRLWMLCEQTRTSPAREDMGSAAQIALNSTLQKELEARHTRSHLKTRAIYFTVGSHDAGEDRAEVSAIVEKFAADATIYPIARSLEPVWTS